MNKTTAALISLIVLFSIRCKTVPPASVRPGESLLDLLTSAECETMPPSLLPPDIQAGLSHGTFKRFDGAAIPRIAWYDAGIPPPRFRESLRGRPDIRFWAHNPRLPRLKENGASDPEIRHKGETPVIWDKTKEPIPIPYIWWDPRTGLLRALSVEPPADVSLSISINDLETVTPLQNFRDYGETTRPADLVQTITLDGVSHRALFAPAPTRISIPVGRLICDTLWFSIGVMDSCLESAASVLFASGGCSDGVSFRIELGTGNRLFAIWEETVSPHEFNRWIDGITVDLRPFMGEFVTFRLSTVEPNGTTTAFDYALWGDLRLYGSPDNKPSGPHIILIDLDTLRRDRMGCYGYHRDTTPWIDSWAEQRCVVYDDCIATSSWTLPSTATMFTGLTVDEHSIDRRSRALSARERPLPLRLRESGYETYGFADGGLVSPGFGFDTGFDIYDCDDTRRQGWIDAIEWVRLRSSEQPFFLFLHTYLVHAPYPYDERYLDNASPYDGFLSGRTIDYETVIYPFLRGELALSEQDKRFISDLYDAQIVEADRHVEHLITSIESCLNDESYMIVLTSDHGEEFFEHGMMGHGQSLYGELLEVPMVIQYPIAANGWITGRNTSPISLTDLTPTILHVAGTLDHDQNFGMSILGDIPHARIRYATFSERVHAIQVNDHKLINGRIQNPIVTSPPVQLYRLVDDPREQNNLSGRDPERVEELIKQLNRYAMKIARNQTKKTRSARYNQKNMARLRALGYVTDSEPMKDSSPVDGEHNTGKPRKQGAR